MENSPKVWKYEYGSLEEIAQAFEAPEIAVVSFDVFDTLLVRPLERGSDLFELLDPKFYALCGAQIGFRKLRTEAEAVLRRRILRKEIEREDIGLDAIYQVMEDEFGIAPDVAGAMKGLEWETELKLCRPRKSGKELFLRARALGKPVILISDMYLSAAQITTLLEKNGYHGMEAVFVSSDRGKRKFTGSLYDEAAACMGIEPGRIFHIGDNFDSDVRMAIQRGLRAAWLPGTMEVYNRFGCAHQVEKICRNLPDWEAAKNSVGIGIMRAMAAEKYFDDPFRAFEETSDYNADPYFVGYGALGMELLALVRWLADQMERDQVKTMLFMARDGYLPMKAYALYKNFHPELPPAGYLHVSRLSLLPAMLGRPEDFFDLPVDISYQTPRKLLRLLAFCRRERAEGTASPGVFSSREETEDIAPPHKFCSREEGEDKSQEGEDVPFSGDSFQKFIAKFIREDYDQEKHRRAVEHIGNYLLYNSTAPVTEEAAVFDMGYSGRIASAVIRAAGVHPKVYYFHTDSREHFRYERRSSMKIRAFFDFNPYMESSLREYAYLEPAASCVAYTEDLQPVYDIGPAQGYQDTVRAMQKGALDFIRDFMEYFAEFEPQAMCRSHEAAMPFEAFLRYCSPYDRKIYAHVLIDDELWGGRRDIHLQELMEIRIRKLPDYAKEKDE